MKSIKKMSFLVVVVCLFILTGCKDTSVEYYTYNQQEAIKLLMSEECRGFESLSKKNCTNAIEGNARAVRKKTIEAATARKAALEKWNKEAQAQPQKK